MLNKELKKKMTEVAKGNLTMDEALKGVAKPKKVAQSGSKQGLEQAKNSKVTNTHKENN